MRTPDATEARVSPTATEVDAGAADSPARDVLGVEVDDEIEVEVAIVGGGPVGLYLGARLAREGITVAVLEARPGPADHARAIGIHPPGLRALAEVGAAAELVRRGVRIGRGRAFAGDAGRGIRPLGALDLNALLPPPFPFVLAVPQPVTEAVLEGRLQAAAPGSLRRGAEVVRVRGDEDGATLTVRAAADGPTDGARHLRVRASLCIACDGSGGGTARRAGFRLAGGRYGDTYLMADGPDDTGLGSDAAIYLPRGGVVESFPLPADGRRWVARTESLAGDARPADLQRLIRDRLGPTHAPEVVGRPSAFGVGWRLADRLARGRVWLAGDAAHVVSPIGGQGMNLGLVGADEAARAVRDHLRDGLPLETAAASYDAAQRPRARAAIARAAWNMRTGRPTALPLPRDLAVRAALSPPLSAWAARLFTMQA